MDTRLSLSIVPRFVRLLATISLLLLVQAAWSAPVTIAMDGQKIVTASAVRMRSEPDIGAKEIGSLHLGEVVRAVLRTRDMLPTGQIKHYWYFVQTGHTKGWVFGSLLRDFKIDQQEKIWTELVQARFARESLSFAEAVDLVAFLDTVLPKTKNSEAKGALSLARLLVLQHSINGLDYRSQEQSPYSAWLKKYKDLIFHDEISGQWLVNVDAYWQLAERYRGTKIGDEIAWQAAEAQLGGECEGDISCNLERENMTYGEYLRRYPKGQHVGDGLGRMAETFAYLETALKEQPNYFHSFRESGQTIDALIAAVGKASPQAKYYPEVLAQLKRIRQAYAR